MARRFWTLTSTFLVSTNSSEQHLSMLLCIVSIFYDSWPPRPASHQLAVEVVCFVAKVWRNVRGQYQFKTAEVTSDLSAAMFFGGIDLYSVHWVHEANRNLASSRYYSDFAIVHHSRFCEANRDLVPGSPARTKICDVTQWSLYHQKTWRRLSLTSLPPFWIDIDRGHSFTLLPRNYLYRQVVLSFKLGAKYHRLQRDELESNAYLVSDGCGCNYVVFTSCSCYAMWQCER